MSDLVKRLGMLAHHLHSLDSESGEGKLLTDAAARIEALEAERDAVTNSHRVLAAADLASLNRAEARIEALEAEQYRLLQIINLTPRVLAADAVAPEGVPDGWRPIETAPNDGEEFIGCADGEMWIVRWNGLSSRFESDTMFFGDALRHWRPLPAPPEE